MKINETLLDAIGNTPIMHLNHIKANRHLNAEIYAKLERCNPTGSIKDRAAKQMILGAMEKGLIHSGTVIIEPTSGNTGIGLAAICASLGLELHIFMPANASIERIQMMRAFGAKVELVKEGGMSACIAAAEELSRQYESAFIPSQFSNPDNARAHYLTTGPEIYDQMDGKIDFFVSAFGTAGTLTGTMRYLKEKNAKIQGIGVEPSSSPFLTEGRKGPHKIQGIGAGFKPEVMDESVIDKILTVSDEDAYQFTRALAREEGLFCGISSGCALAAAVELAKLEENSRKNIVIILPDNGERYLSVEGLFDSENYE